MHPSAQTKEKPNIISVNIKVVITLRRNTTRMISDESTHLL